MPDYERKRVEEKLSEIAKKIQQTNHQILSTRNSEQVELELTRTRFGGMLRRLDQQIRDLEKEQQNYSRQLERMDYKRRQRGEEEEPKDFYEELRNKR